ncbi:MAG: hypothetical protein JWQ11_3529, partial [Rhizobacter sp.]|nr:hypothetical protein [Rhizobacter sp.]
MTATYDGLNDPARVDRRSTTSFGRESSR